MLWARCQAWLKLVFCVTFLIAYNASGLIATETAAVLFS
jgi:hypothetical protein